MIELNTTSRELTSTQTVLDGPNECPFCHSKIHALLHLAHYPIPLMRGMEVFLEVFTTCPNVTCNSSFISFYQETSEGWEFIGTRRGSIEKQFFHEVVDTISPKFSKIYNQAFHAEQVGLMEICGVGYRKALEFVLKDFLISKFPDKKPEIERKFIGQCIKDYVDHPKIKKVAERGLWLGNDQTHYHKRWENKDLGDLKVLINLTINWIEIELMTDEYESAMPNK